MLPDFEAFLTLVSELAQSDIDPDLPLDAQLDSLGLAELQGLVEAQVDLGADTHILLTSQNVRAVWTELMALAAMASADRGLSD